MCRRERQSIVGDISFIFGIPFRGPELGPGETAVVAVYLREGDDTWPKWGSTSVAVAHLFASTSLVAFASAVGRRRHRPHGSEDKDESAREKEWRGRKKRSPAGVGREEEKGGGGGYEPRRTFTSLAGPRLRPPLHNRRGCGSSVPRPRPPSWYRSVSGLGAPAMVQDLHGEGLERSVHARARRERRAISLSFGRFVYKLAKRMSRPCEM